MQITLDVTEDDFLNLFNRQIGSNWVKPVVQRGFLRSLKKVDPTPGAIMVRVSEFELGRPFYSFDLIRVLDVTDKWVVFDLWPYGTGEFQVTPIPVTLYEVPDEFKEAVARMGR